jgi:hypothetical protein
LRTARLRWHVDQTWTRHARSRGSDASPGGPWVAKGDPADCPRQASPATAIAYEGVCSWHRGTGCADGWGGGIRTRRWADSPSKVRAVNGL